MNVLDRPRNHGDWFIPAGLLALGLVPFAVGAVRLVQLAGDPVAAPEIARFFAAPWPVVLHLLGAVAYGVLGAFQFAPGLRRRHPGWHRAAGRWLVACGLVTAFSALWMTLFYPRGTMAPASFDGPLLDAIRLAVATAMAAFLVLGVAAIRRRDILHHEAWMVRAYALGLGAGTQVLTHLPWFLFPGIQGVTTRALCMGSAWAVNLVVAEWLLARKRPAGSA